MKNIARRTLVASSLLASLLATTSFAQAQTKYYARERIVGLPRSSQTADPSIGSPTPSPSPETNTAAWVYGEYGAWSSTCSSEAVRRRSVTCTENGGAVDESRCTTAKERLYETGSQTSGCNGLVVNGTFETGNISPWAGSRGIFGGPASYGAAGSRFVMGMDTSSVATQTVSGLEPGTTYTLTVLCKGHNDNKGSVTARISGATQVLSCGGYSHVSNAVPFTASATTATVTLSNATLFMDIDNVSIFVR
jgi:hypothetical protein